MSQSICKHLRTKKMYIDAAPGEAFANKDVREASPCHFWCNLTQAAVGADDRPAHPSACNASRRCFEE